MAGRIQPLRESTKHRYGQRMLTTDIAQSMLWFWTAYGVVTAVGIGHTVFNIALFPLAAYAYRARAVG